MERTPSSADEAEAFSRTTRETERSLKYLFEQYDFSDFQNFDSSTDRLFNLLPGKEVKEKSEIIKQLSSNPEDNPNFYRGNHPLELIKEMHANKYFTFVLIIRIIKNNSKKFKK